MNNAWRRAAGDPDPVVTIAELDFAEAGFLEQIGELADQIGVDLEFSCSHCPSPRLIYR